MWSTVFGHGRPSPHPSRYQPYSSLLNFGFSEKPNTTPHAQPVITAIHYNSGSPMTGVFLETAESGHRAIDEFAPYICTYIVYHLPMKFKIVFNSVRKRVECVFS